VTLFSKILGVPWDGDKKKVERTDDLSQYHMRHFRHRQLPNTTTTNRQSLHPSPSPPSMNIFSLPHVRTRRSSSAIPQTVWQYLSPVDTGAVLPIESHGHEIKGDEPSPPPMIVNQVSSRILSAPIRSRRIKKKKYTTLQALYMTLYMGELRVDLIDLFTTVRMPRHQLTSPISLFPLS
jgi:hypothetical protein